jgi:hypothetical protein
VRDLVGDDVDHRLQLGLRRCGRVDQHVPLPEGDATEVLHRTEREVGDGDEVELVARVHDGEPVGEEAEGEGAHLERVVRQVLLADRADHPEGLAVDVDGVGRDQRPHHERDQVGGHRHGVREPDGHLRAVARGLAYGRSFQLGGVGDRQQAVGHDEGHAENGLGVGLVPTREGTPGVCGLHLGGGQDPFDAVAVDERGPVEAAQLVVEDTAEAQVERCLTRRERAVERERGPLGLVVAGDLRHERPAAGARLVGHLRRRLVDLDLDGVEHHLARFGAHLDGDGLAAGERGGLEIRLEGQVVPAGQDGAWEPVGVGRGVGQVGFGRRVLL